MNPELRRQHEAYKAVRERIERKAPLVCRAMAVNLRREQPKLPAGCKPVRKPKTPALIDAIEKEHSVRLRCVREAYAAEKDRHRSHFAETMRECSEREQADIVELQKYRRELIAEAEALGAVP